MTNSLVDQMTNSLVDNKTMSHAIELFARTRATDPKLTRRRRRRLRGKRAADRRGWAHGGWIDATGYGLLGGHGFIGDVHASEFFPGEQRAYFKPEGGAEYLDLGEMTPTARMLEKQRRYYLGAYGCGPDRFRAIYPVGGDMLHGEKLLHDYREAYVVDWAALEQRALAHGLTKTVEAVHKTIEESLRKAALHGSSEIATSNEENDGDSTKPPSSDPRIS